MMNAPVVSLADAAMCIAQCAALTPAWTRPDIDLGAAFAELERLADNVEEPTIDGVIESLSRQGFAGNSKNYDDPCNSFLDQVLLRRRGIPIALSVVAIEVGARCGVRLLPIGMPGHFLIRSASDVNRFGDPFHGRVLDRSGCAAIFARLFGPERTLGPDDLEPIPASAVLARILNNLEAGLLGHDLEQLAWMVELHQLIPDLGPGDRVAMATRLELLGRYDDAATQVDAAIGAVPEDVRVRLAARAKTYRARYN